MDNPQQYVDEATFKWTVGGVVALCFGAMGVIWKRLNGLEEKGGQRDDANVKAAKEADDTLWEAHNVQVRDFQSFKDDTLKTLRDVPTRADLDAMEKRLMEAIRHQAARTA